MTPFDCYDHCNDFKATFSPNYYDATPWSSISFTPNELSLTFEPLTKSIYYESNLPEESAGH